MHLAARFYLSLVVALMFAGPARPQDAHNPLRLYAVYVDGGYGVYLGKGFVITAAHVAGLEPRVQIAGRQVPAKVVKRGDVSDVDLTLLSIDEHFPTNLGLRHMPLCQTLLEPDEPVFVAIPEGVARSHILSPSLLPLDVPTKLRTAIRYIAPGNSGSGVFDAREKCLLGIISRKLSLVEVKQVNGHEVREPHEIAKYFVPTSEIVKFIPPEVRF
jgi:hypothetical protein